MKANVQINLVVYGCCLTLTCQFCSKIIKLANTFAPLKSHYKYYSLYVFIVLLDISQENNKNIGLWVNSEKGGNPERCNMIKLKKPLN